MSLPVEVWRSGRAVHHRQLFSFTDEDESDARGRLSIRSSISHA